MSVMPSVKCLRLPGWGIDGIDLHHDTPLALQHLDLRDVAVSPVHVMRCFFLGQFANLRHLTLDGTQDLRHRLNDLSWFCGTFDYKVLGRRLVQYTPLLEVLEMRMKKDSTITWPFSIGSLVGLTKLHTLRISIDHLVFADGLLNPDPVDPHQILPASLRHL